MAKVARTLRTLPSRYEVFETTDIASTVALHVFDPTFVTNVQDRRFLTATIYNYENPLTILGTDNRG